MGVKERGSVIVELFPGRENSSVHRVGLRDGMTLDDLMIGLELPENTEVVIVNDIYVKPDYLLQDGDRVTIFPFLAGG
jgi:sulfur carrier protein ThiS